MMKQLLVISFLLFSVTLFAQNGFQLIRKAEKKMENGYYAQAIKLLEKAESAHYGFCGNAWIDAHEAIILNKLNIYDATTDQLSAVKLLNRPLILWNLDEDSLKMSYFIRLFDKRLIKRELDSVINTYTYDTHFFEQELCVHFTFFDEPYRLSGFLTLQIEESLKQEMKADKDTPKDVVWRRKFAEQPFYQLLID